MESFCTPLAFIDGLGAPEMVMIFVLILLLFGGKKLPEFARGLGKTLREFKKAASGVEEEFKRALEEDERKQTQLKLAEPSSATTPTPDTTAGPGTSPDPYVDHNHEQHYGDYSTETTPPATETPATSTPAAPAGPENKIAAPSPSAPGPAAATDVYNDGPAAPAPTPPPASETPKAS